MNLNDYELVFSDNFNTDGPLDESKWNYEVGNFQWPNKELQAYTDRPANSFIKDGKLNIISLKEQDGEREYTSAKINTRGKAMWQYGYFEIRAKFPMGIGSWPAIWLMPNMKPRQLPDWAPRRSDGKLDFEKMTKEMWEKMPRPPKENRWPNCGEIDMVEHIGRRPNMLLFSLHSGMFNHRNEEPNPFSNAKEYPDGYIEGFHTYGMEWTKDYFEYFVDGESVFKYEKPDVPKDQEFDAWPFDREYYLILNTAVGGGLGGPVNDEHIPYEFQIEYVHVYQKK